MHMRMRAHTCARTHKHKHAKLIKIDAQRLHTITTNQERHDETTNNNAPTKEYKTQTGTKTTPIMADNNKCSCLYDALCTSRTQYQKETAREKYLTLIEKANKLPDSPRKQVTDLINMAKRILGNTNLERAYFHSGTIDNSEHKCEDAQEAITTIKMLDTTTPSPTNSATTKTESSTPKSHENQQQNCSINIEKVLEHRFRRGQLKLKIIIQPGTIPIIENEERVTQIAEQKVANYLKELRETRPRRLNHILRKRPYLVKLFK